MSDRLKALREKRGKIVAEMRALLDKATAEKREPTAEEAATHDRLYGEQEQLRAAIAAEERQLELDREMAERAAADPKSEPGADPKPPKEERRRGPRGSPAYNVAFRKFLAGGVSSLNADEARALQVDSDTAGGYTVAPEQFVERLIQAVDDLVFIRRLGTTWTVTQAEALGVPTLDADPADSDWTTELATGNEDSTMKFGKRELRPHPLAKRIKVSKKLLRASVMPIESIVIERLAYKFGISEEKAFLTGSGAGQPLGVFTASADGIPTTRDVSTGNTTTSITFDGLIEAKYTLKGNYWRAAQWLFHRDAMKQIAKLKDGDGQYLWRMSVREGEPDTVLGLPVNVSEYAPNTFTTGLYVGLLGDFSNYWIVDALNMQVQRLVELYAESNQDGFIGRAEVDGAPVLAEAFVRVKLA